MTDIPVNPPASYDENVMCYSGQALLTNRSYVGGMNGIVRLTFAEQAVGLPPVFRAAVAMHIGDAIGLRMLLDQLLTSIGWEPPVPAPKEEPDEDKPAPRSRKGMN